MFYQYNFSAHILLDVLLMYPAVLFFFYDILWLDMSGIIYQTTERNDCTENEERKKNGSNYSNTVSIRTIQKIHFQCTTSGKENEARSTRNI